MHFLKELIKTPILENPSENHMNIHRHFYRYSKGDFIGPAMKITQTKTKITLKGAHEYEDLILEIVTRSIPDTDERFEIKGILISGENINKILSELGFNWDLKKSTGQVQNYKANILDHITKSQLMESIDLFRENSYLLLSFNLNPNCKVSTKKNIPQPSKKKIEEDDVDKRIQFCTGYLSNTNKNLQTVLELSLSDFKSEIPENWKNITIFNNYKIIEVEIPKNIQNSRILRIMAVRKGKLLRSIDIDGEIYEKQYNIVV
jgi:hypothetical protein